MRSLIRPIFKGVSPGVQSDPAPAAGESGSAKSSQAMARPPELVSRGPMPPGDTSRPRVARGGLTIAQAFRKETQVNDAVKQLQTMAQLPNLKTMEPGVLAALANQMAQLHGELQGELALRRQERTGVPRLAGPASDAAAGEPRLIGSPRGTGSRQVPGHEQPEIIPLAELSEKRAHADAIGTLQDLIHPELRTMEVSMLAALAYDEIAPLHDGLQSELASRTQGRPGTSAGRKVTFATEDDGKVKVKILGGDDPKEAPGQEAPMAHPASNTGRAGFHGLDWFKTNKATDAAQGERPVVKVSRLPSRREEKDMPENHPKEAPTRADLIDGVIGRLEMLVIQDPARADKAIRTQILPIDVLDPDRVGRAMRNMHLPPAKREPDVHWDQAAIQEVLELYEIFQAEHGKAPTFGPAARKGIELAHGEREREAAKEAQWDLLRSEPRNVGTLNTEEMGQVEKALKGGGQALQRMSERAARARPSSALGWTRRVVRSTPKPLEGTRLGEFVALVRRDVDALSRSADIAPQDAAHLLLRMVENGQTGNKLRPDDNDILLNALRAAASSRPLG
jgi:hypothetical protein